MVFHLFRGLVRLHVRDYIWTWPYIKWPLLPSSVKSHFSLSEKKPKKLFRPPEIKSRSNSLFETEKFGNLFNWLSLFQIEKSLSGLKMTEKKKLKSEFFSKMIVRENQKDRKREMRAHWLNKTWNDSLSATRIIQLIFLFLDGLIREKMAQQSHWKRNCWDLYIYI